MDKQTFNTIDDYLDSVAESDRAILEELRRIIHEAAPEAEEAIRYQMPTFRLHGNLVYFGASKNHIGFYPASGMDVFHDELSDYVTSKGAIRFPKDQPLPADLITRIVQYRVQENTAKQRRKKT